MHGHIPVVPVVALVTTNVDAVVTDGVDNIVVLEAAIDVTVLDVDRVDDDDVVISGFDVVDDDVAACVDVTTVSHINPLNPDGHTQLNPLPLPLKLDSSSS